MIYELIVHLTHSEWNIEYSDESMNLTDEHKAEGIYEKWAEPRCADQGGKQKAEDKILYLPKPKVKILASGAEGQALSALEWDDLKRDEHVMIMFTPRFWASSKRGWDAHILAIRAYGTVVCQVLPAKRRLALLTVWSDWRITSKTQSRSRNSIDNAQEGSSRYVRARIYEHLTSWR